MSNVVDNTEVTVEQVVNYGNPLFDERYLDLIKGADSIQKMILKVDDIAVFDSKLKELCGINRQIKKNNCSEIRFIKSKELKQKKEELIRKELELLSSSVSLTDSLDFLVESAESLLIISRYIDDWQYESGPFLGPDLEEKLSSIKNYMLKCSEVFFQQMINTPDLFTEKESANFKKCFTSSGVEYSSSSYKKEIDEIVLANRTRKYWARLDEMLVLSLSSFVDMRAKDLVKVIEELKVEIVDVIEHLRVACPEEKIFLDRAQKSMDYFVEVLWAKYALVRAKDTFNSNPIENLMFLCEFKLRTLQLGCCIREFDTSYVELQKLSQKFFNSQLRKDYKKNKKNKKVFAFFDYWEPTDECRLAFSLLFYRLMYYLMQRYNDLEEFKNEKGKEQFNLFLYGYGYELESLFLLSSSHFQVAKKTIVEAYSLMNEKSMNQLINDFFHGDIGWEWQILNLPNTDQYPKDLFKKQDDAINILKVFNAMSMLFRKNCYEYQNEDYVNKILHLQAQLNKVTHGSCLIFDLMGKIDLRALDSYFSDYYYNLFRESPI